MHWGMPEIPAPVKVSNSQAQAKRPKYVQLGCATAATEAGH